MTNGTIGGGSMPAGTPIHASQDILSASAYRGDGCVLLGFDLAERPSKDFAGFAVKRTPPQGEPAYLLNRLSFTTAITHATKPEQRRWTPSNEAPFQKFRWVDFPSSIDPGEYTYEITAMSFAQDGRLKPGPTVSLTFEMTPETFDNFEIGFTRGYLSSQAYAERFNNAPISPKGKSTFDFDTASFEQQYEWLGFHARKMIFDFLNEALADASSQLDVFAYDLNEPDIIRTLAKFGPRLRLFLDNAGLHTDANALEPKVRDLLVKAAGNANVRVGHFGRFAHQKVFIWKKNGQAIQVLAGSANFSVRGLYVQANNVLRFNDPTIGGLFAQAFDQAFQDAQGFANADIAKQWHEAHMQNGPSCMVAFSPHKDYHVSLDKVTDAIKQADHSVLFAIMQLGGTGTALDQIRALDTRTIFSYGVTQSAADIKFFGPGSKNGKILPFAYLKDKVPAPFKKEWSGGSGQVVHHKFVVVDFNDPDAILFTGSSNLAGKGEEENGDNLLAIPDRGIATAYAVEAMRLLDHYHFRVAMQAATSAKPLMLQPAGVSKQWWMPYYDENHIKFRDRALFSKGND